MLAEGHLKNFHYSVAHFASHWALLRRNLRMNTLLPFWAPSQSFLVAVIGHCQAAFLRVGVVGCRQLQRPGKECSRERGKGSVRSVFKAENSKHSEQRGNWDIKINCFMDSNGQKIEIIQLRLFRKYIDLLSLPFHFCRSNQTCKRRVVAWWLHF